MTSLSRYLFGFLGFFYLTASTVLYSSSQDKKKDQTGGQVKDIVAVGLSAHGSKISIDESKLLSPEIDLRDATFSSLLGERAPCPVKHQAIIVHLAHWAAPGPSGPFQLLTSEWSVYHLKNKKDPCVFKRSALRTDAQGLDAPLLYGDKSAFLIGVSSFVKIDEQKVITTTSIGVSVSILYKVSATPETPENVQNLGMLISGLLGAGKAGGGAAEAKPLPLSPLYVAAGEVAGYKRTPFTFNIGYNLAPLAAANPGQTDATATPPPRNLIPVPNAYVGIAYSEPLPFQGGIGAKTFALRASNQPPASLTVDANGLLHGIPASAGTSTFFVEVTDSAPTPKKVDMMYVITIAEPPASADALKGGAPPAKPASTSADANGASTSTDQQTASVVDCTSVIDKSPCSFKRSFRSQDKEYWDIGLSVPIPGVKETTFTLSNGVAKSSVTRHVDVYAFLDIYPLAHCFDKRSAAFHFAVGVPIANQSLYRPFFGAAENFTNWTGLRRRGFPLELSVFAGVVDMRIQVPTQMTSGGATMTVLTKTRTVKALYGIELSVTDLASKLGAKSKKSGS
jgi:hypothetical protein